MYFPASYYCGQERPDSTGTLMFNCLYVKYPILELSPQRYRELGSAAGDFQWCYSQVLMAFCVHAGRATTALWESAEQVEGRWSTPQWQSCQDAHTSGSISAEATLGCQYASAWFDSRISSSMKMFRCVKQEEGAR